MAEVGSSSKSTCGLRTSALANPTSCRCPPERAAPPSPTRRHIPVRQRLEKIGKPDLFAFFYGFLNIKRKAQPDVVHERAAEYPDVLRRDAEYVPPPDH